MSPLFLGIDLGTSAVKAVVVDRAGAVAGSGEAGVRNDSAYEQRVTEVWAAMLTAVNQAVGACDIKSITALAFSSAMHGFMAVDGEAGPLTTMMTWADGRAKSESDRLAHGHPELQSRTGCPPTPLYYPARLQWLKANHPQIFQDASKFVSIKDWVVYRLTGRWTADRSHASSNGLLNIHDLCWDEAALAAAGIDRDRLPELTDSDAAIGEILPQPARELGLPAGIIVAPGAGDGGLANLGAGAVDPGQAALTIGTSGAMRKIIPEPWGEAAGRLWCYYLADGRWYAGGAINSGGIVMRWLRDGLLADVAVKARESGMDPYQAIIGLAEQAGPGAGGLMFLPYLYGERTPYWDPAARGVLFGLGPRHGKEDLARAALEGICFALAHVHQLLEASPGGIAELRATGGFTRSPFWVQLLADILGRPIALPKQERGSAFGAAIMAMKAAGTIKSIAEVRNFAPIERVFEPDPNLSDFYRERLEFFKGLYQHLQGDFAKWAEISAKT